MNAKTVQTVSLRVFVSVLERYVLYQDALERSNALHMENGSKEGNSKSQQTIIRIAHFVPLKVVNVQKFNFYPIYKFFSSLSRPFYST